MVLLTDSIDWDRHCIAVDLIQTSEILIHYAKNHRLLRFSGRPETRHTIEPTLKFNLEEYCIQ